MIRIITIVLFMTIISSFSYGQFDIAYRNKNWKPKQGKYLFTQMMVYKYKNEIVDLGDDFHHDGEMVIYFDEVSGTMLLTAEAYGLTGEMIDFILVEPSGKYTFASTDEFGKQQKLVMFLDEVFNKNQQITVSDNFKTYLKTTNNKKTFGKNSYQWPTIMGIEYLMPHELDDEISYIYIAKYKMNMNPIYAFNRLKSETKLPVDIDFDHLLPEYYLVLSSSYKYQGEEVSFELIAISPTEYFVDLKDYKIAKKQKP